MGRAAFHHSLSQGVLKGGSLKSVHHPAAAHRLRVRRPGWSPYRYTRWRWHVLFTLIDAVGWLVFGPLKLLNVAFGRWSARPVRSLLLVQLDHLGDAVMSLGLLAALRRRFPTARLHVLAAPWNRQLFASCGCVDQVHVMDVTRFSRRGSWRWLAELVGWGWRLRRLRLDVAIDARGEFPHALLLWLSGARRRVGWACGGGGFLLTDRVPYVAGRHEVLSRAAIAGRFGIAPTDVPPPRIEPAPSDVQWADDQLHAAWPAGEPGELSGPIIAVHLAAGTPAKCWPAESWQELAQRLVRERNARIVLVGTQEDRETAEMITAAGVQPLDLVGRLSLTKLAAVLQRADLLIGADSGPAHVAAAVGTRVLALFSGTNDPRQWRPWGEAVTVIRNAPVCSPCHREICPWADHPCMRGLSVESVHRAADRTLELLAAMQAGGLPAISRRSRSAPPVSVAIHAGTPEGCQHDAVGRRFSIIRSSRSPAGTPPGCWGDLALLFRRCAARPRANRFHPFGVAARLLLVRASQWLLAAWMAVVAAAYLWHMLAGLGS